ncbi:MAG: hypothetical protein JWN56_2338 [Sphingobacteriales bacterium]|nr:hypothetical protein [Sphingobacteriales bacterium]
MFSCNNGESVNKSPDETILSGSTQILVDESFRPIIEDQLYVFNSSYPNAHIELIFKPEIELLNIFLSDSIRVGIMSRELTKDEAKFYVSKNVKIRKNRFAIDGIAIITSNSNADSTVTVNEIIDIMRSKTSNIKTLVFDNPNSSTVRYFKELANVKNLPNIGVYGLKSNAEVVKYVNDHPGSVGVVGINWIQEPPEDLEKIIPNIRVMGVKNLPGKPGSDDFYKPSQSNLALGLYPFTRNLYIINCQGRAGLGTGFASFLAGERGQRIVLKSGLLPDSVPSREVIIRK